MVTKVKYCRLHSKKVNVTLTEFSVFEMRHISFSFYSNVTSIGQKSYTQPAVASQPYHSNVILAGYYNRNLSQIIRYVGKH